MPTIITARITSAVGRKNQTHDCIHRCHVIGMLVSGEGYCTNGNVRSPATTPWLTLVPEGRNDGNYLIGPYESRYVCFRWEALKVAPGGDNHFVIGLHGVRQRVTPFVELDSSSASLCAALLEEIRDDLVSRDVGRLMRAEEGVLRLLRTYMQLGTDGQQIPEHRELQRFRSLITRHALDRIGLEEMAAECRMTPDHLGRLFRRAYGYTPKAYRTALRMDRASDLLASSRMNVSEVSRQVGYDDPLYFSRAFHRHFGFPPSKRIRALPWPPRRVD